MLWLDGRLGAGTRAPFDLADRGLSLGDGVFDTALALGGRVAFEAAHVERLARAAETLGIPADRDVIRTAMRALAGQDQGGGPCAIRTTLTRGSGPRGLRPPAEPAPVLFATMAPSPPGLRFAPVRLWPTGIARNETSPASRLKTLGYLDAVLAAGEAAAGGFDEALFLNTRGRVACAGTGNLFAIRGDRLATPPASEGVLAGVTRAVVLDLATACGLVPEERPLEPAEIREADAAFLTNSLRLLAPVAAVGETALASAGHPALLRLAVALRAAAARACGIGPEALA